MKKIILDHFRRWWLVLIAILLAYFAFQLFSIHENNSQIYDDRNITSIKHTIHNVHSFFIFQILMILGFLLLFDLQRGLPRVLISLPITTKQIGRAWWLASVAFPAIALGSVGLLEILFFPGKTNITTLSENYLMNWTLAALYLGAMFGALTFMPTMIPDTFMDRIRNLFFGSLFALTIFGIIFLQFETLTTTKAILIFTAYAILSVLGWFRAEQMVLQRASFRLVAQSSRKKPQQHKVPRSFGGLPYLAQRTFIQTTLVSFVLIIWMTFAMSFFFHNQNLSQAIIPMIHGGSTPYVFFVLLFSIVPVAFQLRVLRTLPISPSVLTAILIFLPIVSIAIVGLIVIAVASAMSGEAVVLPAINDFLMLGVKAAIMVPLIVWRGLDVLTYIFIFFMMVSGSFVSLGLTLIFHLGTKAQAHPLWMYLTIFLLCVAASFALTRRLLTKSSSAYRVRTLPANTWPVWGGVTQR
jgi:hypothetical protein